LIKHLYRGLGGQRIQNRCKREAVKVRLKVKLKVRSNSICVGEIESLQSSLCTANGRANQLQRSNELLESQISSLKIVVTDYERQHAVASTDAKQLSTGRDLEIKRHLHEISELKQQVSVNQ